MAASISDQGTRDLWNEIRSLSSNLTRAGSAKFARGGLAGSLRAPNSRNWSVDHEFAQGSAAATRRSIAENEEVSLEWAALEKLPTYDRVRTTFVNELRGSKVFAKQVNLQEVGPEQNEALFRKIFGDGATAEDNQKFLGRLRDRLHRVGIKIPTVEVRFEELNIEAQAHVGGRALPTLINAARDTFEGLLDMVGIPVAKKRDITILRQISGIVKPGRLTLLLGPPGSGKTSLMLALAGRLTSDLKVQGRVTYNGYTFDEFVPQKTSAYVSQHDLHLGDMTVRETLDFSARCQGIGKRSDLVTELVKREKETGVQPEADLDFFMKATSLEEKPSSLVTDYILKLLGLDICADTLVGDDMHRGISGGQRKRVTTGELIVGPMKTLFMDEISTGLDSSTTFQIIKCIGDVAHVLESTVVIALLQPAPETYNLFDDIILLSDGQTVYHGPRENILEFFESMGYRCPPRKGVADFLQEVTSKKDQQQYWSEKRRPYRYTHVTEFADAFKKFHVGVDMSTELETPYDKSMGHKAALEFNKYSVSTKELFKTNFQKEWMLMKRSSFVYVFRAVQISFMALITMSVFFRTQMTRNSMNDAQVYSGALFFGVVNIMFNGFAELSMTISRLPVFYKQRDLLFFPAWTFGLSKFIQSIPVSVLESTIWIILTYFTVGFALDAGRFFRQLLCYFWVHQMSTGLFRLIAAICRTMIIANTGGSMSLLVIFVLGGFLIPRTAIKPWWIWGYWVSPLSYAQNAIDVNEFLAPEWHKYIGGSKVTLGVQFMLSTGKYVRGYWYWLVIGVLIGYTILFNILFTLSLTYLNPLGKATAVVPEEDLAEKDGTVNDRNSVDGAVARGGSLRRIPSNWEGRSPSRSMLPFERFDSPSLKEEIDATELREMTLAGSAKKRGMILPFEPLSISFNDVKYYVDMPTESKQQGMGSDKRLQLLRGITGAFQPGVLTALVGVSGAGKSTLMDVLAGRKTGGYIEGDIRISGFPKKQETFARISGYCEQNDIHSPQVTVHESLIYSAWLRLAAEVDKSNKKLFVDQVMELVELTTLKDSLVGLPGVTGLSTEQRKRLTIAVELVANPSIIFMDEPTSGLDARAASIVMRTVRNTVDTGRTVVCTIHQPSIDIFEAFDELLLMKRGGEVIYAGPLGPRSHKLVEYFEAVPGVPPIHEGYNPATWMLEVSSSAVEQRLGVDFADIYRKSPLFAKNKTLVEELSTPAPNAMDLSFPTQFSQPFSSQVAACLWKQHLTYWRSPDYNNVRFFFTLCAAILFGTIFWNLGSNRANQTNLFSIVGAMFGAVLFIGINNSSTVQPVVSTERTVFYREKAAGMYSPIPYAVAQVLIEVPYVLIQAIIYSIITYAMIGLEWTATKFMWYFFCLFFTFLYFTFYGMMAVGLTPNHQISTIVASFFYGLFNLFSGFLITKTRIPKWWIWYYWSCPVAWTLYGLVASQFADVDDKLTLPDGSVTTVRIYIGNSFGYKHSFLPVVATMLVIFPVLFAGVFMVAIKVLNFQNR